MVLASDLKFYIVILFYLHIQLSRRRLLPIGITFDLSLFSTSISGGSGDATGNGDVRNGSSGHQKKLKLSGKIGSSSASARSRSKNRGRPSKRRK